MKVKAYAAPSPEGDLVPFQIERRTLGPHDIHIDIDYCGVCHSDIHTAKNDWGGTVYPAVPGHEIVGKIIAIGDKVSGFKVGELVGVGCMVNSCQTCSACKEDMEQFCENGATYTYNSVDKVSGGTTYGGYSESVVVDEQFVLHVSDKLDVKAVAPLLCAGITTYSPLRHWNVKAGDKVGIIGLGGLGHMGVKLAAAMGAQVTMITTSTAKGQDAKKLGAHDVLISTDPEAMKAQVKTFDFLLNTIPVPHNLNLYLPLLKRDRTMVMVGATQTDLHSFGVIQGRKSVAGSLIGGIKETQEMLDFCAEHNIVSDVEMINMKDINAAYDRVNKSDVKYRFVIDMKSLKQN